MLKEVISTGKTIDEAIEKGILNIGIDKEYTRVEIIQIPTKKLFGLMGVTEAKVRIIGDKDPCYLAGKFVEDLLRVMNIGGIVKVTRNADNIEVSIDGLSDVDKGILIGKRGATLDAIQYITSTNSNKIKEKYRRVILNIENYREQRENTLVNLSKKLANTVKKTRKQIRLEPMNPYERRIIHSTLHNEKNIKTFSEGEEPYRRIVIEYKR